MAEVLPPPPPPLAKLQQGEGGLVQREEEADGEKENQGPGPMNAVIQSAGKTREELEAELRWIKRSIRDRIQVSRRRRKAVVIVVV